ncbi:MAG: 50S ribosomal protein L11 methyltransferase [Flavobacteriales bacterium]|nr:50S ribosomal protein L11 methyltransferase [Flavobacteriales bacterium]
MIYISYTFKITPREPATEILIAELGYAGFESFVENEDGVIAYIQKEEFTAAILDDIFILSSDEFQIEYKKEEIAQVNWNKEWENNFNPIQVDGLVSIRAPFHENPNLEYDIVIEPKMSFGTGHHQTTHLMISYILDMDVKNMSVMDMGCGTGILAILAAQKGATNVDAIDIDEWAFENTMENAERNNVGFIVGAKGDASLLKGDEDYDLFIANINRNILINDMSTYAKSIKKGGQLLLSGFYDTDIEQLVSEAEKNGFELQEKRNKETWAALRFKKLN